MEPPLTNITPNPELACVIATATGSIKGLDVLIIVLVASSPQILLRLGPSDGTCSLCGDIEHVDHIFFQCSLAQFFWSGVREMFGVAWNPRSRLEWFAILDSLNPKAKRAM
jgi:hypothetical protein